MVTRYAAACAAVAALALPSAASATAVSSALNGANGEGTYNPTLSCAAGGDGANYRYAWIDQQASSPGGVLGGEWDGTFEVHEGGGRSAGAFIPDGTGRIAITVARGGSGFLETRGGGSCSDAALALTGVAEGEPVVSGTLPIVATGGIGALRGLSGNGTATFTLQLGPGADNAADIAIDGDFDVTGPLLAASGATSRWQNLSAYLGHKLTVTVTIANALAGGQAFDARISGVTGGSGSYSGLPTAAGPIAPGGSRAYTFTMNGAQAGRTYTLGVTVAAKDGLLGDEPPVTGSVTFKSPSLP